MDKSSLSSSSSSSPENSDHSRSDSDSDTEVLHELCNKVNLGLATNSTVASEQKRQGSLSAITTDGVTDIQMDKSVTDAATLCPSSKGAVSKSENRKKSLTGATKIQREPILKRKDTVDKVLKIIDSRTFVKPQPSPPPAKTSIPKDTLVLNAETLLILNLLGMSSEAREQYLIEVAKQRKLLLTNSNTNTFNVNPDLFGVNNVPQVVDFVHQFHGKPIPSVDERNLSANFINSTARKLKQKLKKKDKQQMNDIVLRKDNHKTGIIHAICDNVQRPAGQNPFVRGKQQSQQLPTSAKIASKEMRSNSLNVSMNQLNNIPNKKPRTLSATEPSGVCRILRSADTANIHRHDAGEEFSKRQQKRLRKQLKALSIQSTLQANAANTEKAPRKRGSRGSKKEADEAALKLQQHPTKNAQANTSKSKTDMAAKNLIRSKCSQINVKIQEKLNLCSTPIKPGPSTSQTPDLVVESIERVEDSDGGNDDSSSDTSDSSNFPSDEETSYMARSDEMESSCNERRIGSTVDHDKSCLNERSVLNDVVTTPCDTLSGFTMDAQQSVFESNQSFLGQMRTTANASLQVNNENLLIMSLLTVSEKTRNSLLQKAAVDANIFLKSQDKNLLNSRLVRMKGVFSSPDIVKFIEDNTSKQRKEKATYESEVNKLVRHYVPEIHMYKFILSELALLYGRYAFNDPVNRKVIDLFVESLIAANLGRVIEGDIRVNEYDNTEAYMTNEDDDRDIYFSSILLRQCAIHCTRVKAFVFTAEDRTLFGRGEKRIVRGFVTELLDDQSKKQIIGKFKLSREATARLVIIPEDRRFPRIKIDKTSDPKLFSSEFVPKEDTLYLVKLNYWKDKKPYGIIVEEIGKADELEAGNRAVLLKNSLKPLVFTDRIMEALPKEPYIIPEAEYNSRENLMKSCIFTIDPLTARDLDDAVSCRQLENGNYEIGVHISDVTHFISENSELDNMIKDQATTIYLVNTVYHMLPRELCMLCSLLPGQDKLTFSVFWEMTPKAQIVSTRFAKTIINSCSQLAYEHAQLMINQPDREFEDKDLPKIHNGFSFRDLSKVINTLNSVAVILRKKRFDNGCISINQTKIIFDLNEDGDPIAFRPDERGESNFLIEEFMLLANQSVAKCIYEKFPNNAVLRNHAPPKKNMMEELVAKVASLNCKMDISSSKAIANSMAAIIRASGNNVAVCSVLNSMVAKPMVRAEYFCSSFIKNPRCLYHFALSIPIYTHFTSPIRRYPDILVHRVLAAAINLAPVPTRTPKELKVITRVCNDQKYNAKLAGEDSTNLYFIHYLLKFGPIKMRAAVKEQSKGADLHLMLIDSGHNIRVSIKRNVPELKYILLEDGIPCVQFVGCKNVSPIRVNIFDVVLVEVFTKDEKLKANLVLPE